METGNLERVTAANDRQIGQNDWLGQHVRAHARASVATLTLFVQQHILSEIVHDREGTLGKLDVFQRVSALFFAGVESTVPGSGPWRMNVAAPSTLTHTFSLTGDRNTEIVIEAVAQACARQDDRWTSVPVHLLKFPFMASLDPTSVSSKESLQNLSSGRLILQAEQDGWVRFSPSGQWLSIELTEKSFQQMLFTGHLTAIAS